ncbi:MAG: hypothetical protein PVH12_02580 [Candidatus Bathyarchaeota archaeon]|jgi:hypothetical protein
MSKIKPLVKGSLARKILRALRKDSGFELPVPSREEKCPGVSAYDTRFDSQQVFNSAMLEAEQSRAKCLMECQRHNMAR